MTDSPAEAINAYQQRIEWIKAEAPRIAAEIFNSKPTLAAAIRAAELDFHGFLQHLIIEHLRALHAAEAAPVVPLKPRRKRPRGASPMVQAAASVPPVRRPRGNA